MRRGWKTWLFSGILVTHAALRYELIQHKRGIPRLSAVAPGDAGSGEQLPRLSVIVPARNEEEGIGQALESLLDQDYPNLELVVVDDRSEDRTREVIGAASARHPGHLRTIAVTELPPGGLGQNHALWLGARQTSGEWLLFADADVVFEPSCCRRAVWYAEREGLGHVTMSTDAKARSFWLDAFISLFLYGFIVTRRPHLANDPQSKIGLGMGAFNLMRRSEYLRIGTHAAISLRPDDDLRLGTRAKQMGVRQRVLRCPDLLCIEWYPSLRAVVEGFEKNVFAVLEYNPLRVAGTVAGVFTLMVLPYLALLREKGANRMLAAVTVALHSANLVYANKLEDRQAWSHAVVLPVTTILFIYTVLNAILKTIARGGIRWRGTFYSLDELRQQTGLEQAGDLEAPLAPMTE